MILYSDAKRKLGNSNLSIFFHGLTKKHKYAYTTVILKGDTLSPRVTVCKLLVIIVLPKVTLKVTLFFRRYSWT